MRNFVTACLASSVAMGAWAARPFITDDARLTNAGKCQLESWSRFYADSRELWAMPACNPWGNFEVTLGQGQTRDSGEAPTHDDVAQAKTLLKPLDTDGWGVGLAVGVVRHVGQRPGPNGQGNTFAYVPLSVSFDHDRVVMHANLGVLREHAGGAHHVTWGCGGEWQAWPRLGVIAEAFGDERHRPFMQAGARFGVLPGVLQIDATVGQPWGSARTGRWLSLGVRYTP